MQVLEQVESGPHADDWSPACQDCPWGGGGVVAWGLES
jgi:hypothetical protein